MPDRPCPAWLTPEVRSYLATASWDFQVRAFGEQLARINALPLEQRLVAFCEMMDYGWSKGVIHDKPALGVTP